MDLTLIFVFHLLYKDVWAGEGAGRDPLSHMRQGKTDFSGTLSRSVLFQTRKGQNISMAKKFRPRKTPGIHKVNPSNYANENADYWFKDGTKEEKKVPDHYLTVANREMPVDPFKVSCSLFYI